MDDDTWGAFEVGWRGALGAEADHRKTTGDLDECAAGFTLSTIDPGEHVTISVLDVETSALQG